MNREDADVTSGPADIFQFSDLVVRISFGCPHQRPSHFVCFVLDAARSICFPQPADCCCGPRRIRAARRHGCGPSRRPPSGKGRQGGGLQASGSRWGCQTIQHSVSPCHPSVQPPPSRKTHIELDPHLHRPDESTQAHRTKRLVSVATEFIRDWTRGAKEGPSEEVGVGQGTEGAAQMDRALAASGSSVYTIVANMNDKCG